MSDNELTSEDLIAAWRTTASGQDKEETYTCAICNQQRSILDPCDHTSLQDLENDDLSPVVVSGLPPGYGVSIDDIVATQPMVPSGILFDPSPNNPTLESSGIFFYEYSYVNQPADPANIVLSTLGEGEWTLSNAQPNALLIDDGDGGGVKINFSGEVELLGDTTITDASKLFWDLVQIEGINNKNQLELLQKENSELADRIKELEIKLGYRKADVPEETDNRFEGILDD